MAQTVDVLKYILDLDTKKFTASAKTADTQTKKLSKSIGSTLKNAIMGAVGAWSAYQALNIVKDLAIQGAVAERAANSWRLLAESFGLSSQTMIEELREASAGTVADIELMMQASRAAIMGLPLEDLPRLIKISRAAAKAFGQSTSFMFESIVLGTARQSRLILDNLGIIINETDVYKKEVEKLERQLTDAEKKQAFFNEVLKQGQNIIDRVGGEAEDTKDKIDQLSASWQNFTDEIGKTITKAVEPGMVATALDQLTEFIKGLNIGLDLLSFEKIKKVADTLEKMFGGNLLDKRFASDILALGDLAGTIKELLAEGNLPAAFDLTEGVIDLLEQLGVIPPAVDDMGEATDNLVDNFEGLDEALKKSNERWEKFLELMGLTVTEAEKVAKMVAGFDLRPTFAPGISDPGGVSGPQEAIDASIGQIDVSFLDRVAMDIQNSADVIGFAMEDIAFHVSETAQAFTEAAIRLVRGDVAGAVSVGLTAIIDAYASIYGGGESSVRNQVDALDKLTEAYERNIQALNEMTIAENAEAIANLRTQIEIYQRTIREGDARFRESTQAGLQWLQDMLAEAEAIQDRFDELRGVTDFQEAIDFLESLAAQGALGFQQGMNLVSFFTEMFDLSEEQQVELIQTLQDLLGDDITAEQWMQMQTAIERLQEEGIEVTQALTPTQTLRSVTIITESQANLLLGVLNAINLEVRKIVSRIDMILEEMRSGIAGGGSVFHITINSSSASGQAVARALMVEVRGKGTKVSV